MTPPGRRYRIVICRGADCGAKRNSRSLQPVFAQEARALGIERAVDIDWHSCFGRCSQGPNVLVRLLTGRPEPLLAAPVTRGPGTALYNGVTPESARRILEVHVIQGTIVRDLVRPPEAALVPARTKDPGSGNDPSGENGGESR
jgi:(2Fe-2S) ferredoxin